MKRAVYIFLLCVVALTSCDTYNKVYKSNDYDNRYEAAKAYYVEGYPMSFFINADGELVAYWNGMLDLELLESGIEMIR